MGRSTDAHCFACGYDKVLMVGSTRANFRTHAAWPVSCHDCAAITTANFMQKPLKCQKCSGGNVVPVADRSQWRGDGEIEVGWGEMSLTNGHYRCPKCGAFELRFGTNACGHESELFD